MKILIVDGPGVHPRSAARALGAALHAGDHGVIVHPIQLEKLGWFRSQALAKHAVEVLKVHEPDVIHVLSAEAWVVDAFVGRGVPVVHSAFNESSRADWIVVPSQRALTKMGGRGPNGDNRYSVLPYPVAIGDPPACRGEYVLAHVDKKDKAARKWLAAASALHPHIPIRYDGVPEDARLVVSLTSKEELWPVGVAEAMAAGRAVIAGWNGAAAEFVLEGVTGFLSAPGDTASLASHLQYLWDQPVEAVTLGLAARDEAEAAFGGEEQLRTLMRWYLRAGISRLAV